MSDEKPRRLYKAFSSREHMEAFLNGRLIVRPVKEFQKIEDEHRRDRKEGEALYRVEGPVESFHLDLATGRSRVNVENGLQNHSAGLANCVYVYCTSSECVDLEFLADKFGPYIVEIMDPEALQADLESYFETMGCYPVSGFRGGHVEYDKGEQRQAQLRRSEESRLSYMQKEPHFSPECEYRFAVMCSYGHTPLEYVDVDLEKRPTYLRQVRRGL